MCGICGQYDSNGVDVEILHKMAEAIRHRGPDDDGFYVNGPIGLGNRRLSIIDLSGGKQPISNEDDTIWIVFNGEIYNYPALREMLVDAGHQFKTHTDTEVIIHLYEEYGVEAVKKLRGMFTFAIWDQNKQLLFIARDPLGQKHLYYSCQNDRFVFGSEVKCVLVDQSIKPELDTWAMHHAISLRCLPDEHVMFKNISKLPAGHFLTYQNQELHVECYWDQPFEPKLEESEADIIAQLRSLLLETVECHMLSDVPLGAFLSGGIDSSLIAAMMSEISDTPIKTFSIGVKEEDFSELPYARQVAEKYNTEHYEYIVEPNVVKSLPEMMWYMEEPVDPFAFGVYSVSKLASEHVKVVLGGDGGDEMFAGYDRYLGNQIVDYYCLLPRPLRKAVVEPMIGMLADDFSYNNRVQKLRWMVAMSETSDGERYAQSASFLRFGQSHKETLYSESLWKELGHQDAAEYLLRYFNSDVAQQSIDKMLYTDVKTRLADHLLTVGDRMTMAHSLEGRSPYVDQKLVEFVGRIPTNVKLKGRRLKHALREAARGYLPDTLIDRHKQGFSFPLAYWFRNELQGLTRDIFSESRLVEEGYFQKAAMLNLLDEHVQGTVDHNYRLWLLLNMELWYRMFIDGQSIDDLNGQLELRQSVPA
ncbi:MAG: asparagine synthase (glutamine-hydrolyzing) [Anaerolineae bacterium]|nr:asparagine synthase (glutamine-hydrolyzing) [Anaerolineae bacterium]